MWEHDFHRRMETNRAMNRRVDIDLEVQWPPARASEKWSVPERLAPEQMLPDESLNRDVMQEMQSDDEALAAAKAVGEDLKTYGSSELFEGAKEVGIKHAGSVYRLKITRQGKLILNK